MAKARQNRKIAAMLALAGAVMAVPVAAVAQEPAPVPAPPAPAMARKVALLIGNSAYAADAPDGNDPWPRLRNPDNDVQLVKRALQAIGFEVTLVTDADVAGMDSAISGFAAQARGAGIALFYYGGHGFEYDRHNYLVPTDAPTKVSATALPRRFVDLEDAARAIDGARVTVLMLDACRNTGPIVSVSDTETSALIKAKSIDDYDYQGRPNVGVLYSTARGVAAKDAVPDNAPYSPFALEVAQNVVVPKIDLVLLFSSISQGVRNKTSVPGPAQAPYTYNDLGVGHYLYTGPAVSLSALMSTSPVEQGGPGGLGRGIVHGGEPQPLRIDPKVLETTDESVLAVQVLKAHPVAELEELAARQDPLATYLLGFLYEFGVGVDADLSKARTLLENAAALGTPEGQLELGYFLLHHPSEPVEADYRRAFGLIRLAAEADFAKARGHYAEILMGGEPRLRPFLDRNAMASFRAGLDQLRLAADKGYPYAMYALALRSFDPAERARWQSSLEDLARANDADGDHWLCVLGGQANDAALTGAHCLAAAQAGFPDAQAQMAFKDYQSASTAAPGPDRDQALADARHWARQALAQTAMLQPDILDRLNSLNLFPEATPAQGAAAD